MDSKSTVSLSVADSHSRYQPVESVRSTQGSGHLLDGSDMGTITARLEDASLPYHTPLQPLGGLEGFYFIPLFNLGESPTQPRGIPAATEPVCSSSSLAPSDSISVRVQCFKFSKPSPAALQPDPRTTPAQDSECTPGEELQANSTTLNQALTVENVQKIIENVGNDKYPICKERKHELPAIFHSRWASPEEKAKMQVEVDELERQRVIRQTKERRTFEGRIEKWVERIE